MSNMLERITSGHYSTMPTDRELGDDLTTEAPPALHDAMAAARAHLAMLQAEADTLPDMIKVANSTGNVEEYNRLKERDKELNALLLDAQLAALNAERAIYDAMLSPLLEENEATKAAIAAMEAITPPLDIARRRRDVIGQKITNIRALSDKAAQRADVLAVTQEVRPAQADRFRY